MSRSVAALNTSCTSDTALSTVSGALSTPVWFLKPICKGREGEEGGKGRGGEGRGGEKRGDEEGRGGENGRGGKKGNACDVIKIYDHI